MATSTFDRTFVVAKAEDQRRIWDLINSEEPAAPINVPSRINFDREQNKKTLRDFFAKKDAESTNQGQTNDNAGKDAGTERSAAIKSSKKAARG